MEEVRQLVQEEGREARNLVAFHVAVDPPAPTARVARKPPRGAPPPRRVALRSAARLRSASAGRDKRSELRARYWALLFGDLQRSVGEIYNTVEAHENLNECQEVILVLENYTRDFKALGEWFRLKWEYDNTPPPQRPQSLAWEIRKTDFVRPESRRTHSVKSSPSVSGKNSPCLSGHNTPSGKNSPNLTGKSSPGSGKISPRISNSSTSPKGSIEFFSNKIASKIATKPEPKIAKETRLSDIKEKDIVAIEDAKKIEKGGTLKEKEDKDATKQVVEIGKAKEYPNVTPKHVVVKTPKRGKSATEDKKATSDTEISSQVKATIAKLHAMENEFLAKQLAEHAAKNENLLNRDIELDKMTMSETSEILNESVTVLDSIDKDSATSQSPAKSEDNFADVSIESFKSSDEKPANIINANTDELNTASDLTVTSTENKSKNVTMKKKDAKFFSVKKDSAAKGLKEMYIREKLAEAKDNKKEPNNKITKQTKGDSVKNEDSDKDQNKLQKINWVEYCEADVNEVKDICIVNNKNDDQEDKRLYEKEDQENKLDDEKKPESKSPELNNAEGKESKKEDNDSKKAEAKAIDAKPRPAYSQAAAKPKLVTPKAEVKTPTKTTLYRSKTVVEIRPTSAPSRQLRPNGNAKNKCSYPFNLTTGRTSLFDTPGATKVTATKKPTSRPQLAAGDARNQIKPDHKTIPSRPESLKMNEQGDKEEKINPAFEKIKDCDEYSSSETVVTQIDMSRIESSESLKTMVPEGSDVANSIEVLNVDGDKNDNDGWLTVKSRRLSRESKKSKCHWANRFRQPSATTSLPTLNIIESPKSESNPVDDSKLDRAKSEQPQHALEKVVKVTAKKEPKARDASMIRQKSDVTGLKTRTSRNKALKKDKNRDKKDSELTKNRLHSSLESLTTGLARSQESTEEDAFDFDKWKAEFMNTFKYLEEDDQMTNHNEILKTADPSEMSEIAEMTSQIEENERKISLALDFQSEADQKKLCEEEDLLNRQIMELQQVSDIDIDTETDDTETDAEIICDHSAIIPCKSADYLVCRNLTSCLEHHYEKALEGMTWSERIDMLGVLEELVARDPEAIKILIQGRAQQLHAKLSQGIRRRGSLQDVLRRLQAKQARAEKQRMEQHTERARRIHRLLGRVEEVKMAKNQLIEEKRNRMERRLQKAAENRDQHLKDIVRKAHDEEEKLREIAFIKQLEAENRRHEFLEHCRALTSRLRQVRRERLHKLEQKAAREAAVGARRQALEAARRDHVQSLLDRRKERDARREELKEQKKQERDDAAREKAEGVRSRLSALAAAARLEALALRSRIRHKQDASQLRLESHLQAIREKATGPRQPTTSESQEASAKEADAEPGESEAEAERRERERQRVLRKKARKMKQKILTTSKETHLAEHLPKGYRNPHTGKMQRLVSQLSNLLAPLLNPDHNPTSHDVDCPRARKHTADPPADKIDFKYDFEDKMGKRKRKKRAQEKADEGQKSKQKNRPNDTKSNGKANASKNGQSDDLNSNNNVDAQKNKNNPENDTLQNTNDTQNKDSDAPKLKSDTQKTKKDKQKINAQNETQKNNDAKKTKTDTLKNKNKTQDNPESADKSTTDAEKGQNETQKSKNEAQKGKNETQKLSKSESICSAASEGSKASAKLERPPLMLDVNQVEKLAGEIYRMTPKDISDPKSKQTEDIYTKIYAIKAFGQLYTILAEREDLLSQLTHKCLAMCVVTSSRLMASCKPTALYFFSSAAAVHIICLLNYQLSKDLSDRKDLEVTKQLCDLISVCLDAALSESRTRECNANEMAPMGAIRGRAHNLISYLCLSGTIARAEQAGEARERIQTLVTLCADLCQSHKTDIGSERVTALQSLRSALGTGLMGSRAEFCMLFAEGAELSRSQNFVRAARTTHLLRQLAELDHQIVQDAFGEDGWPLEFRAAVARLLSQHAPNDKEAPDSDVLHLSNQRLDLTLSEQMVLDLIVLVGYVVVNNPGLHDTICENWGVIKTLCTLPANWLVSEFHSHSLLPTLVVLAERTDTAKVICSELSMKMLENYMNSADGQKVKLIQVLKAAKDKAAKKGKQGRKDKPQAAAEDNQNEVKDIPNGDANNDANSDDDDDAKDDLTNGDVKHGENEAENDSITVILDDEV